MSKENPLDINLHTGIKKISVNTLFRNPLDMSDRNVIKDFVSKKIGNRELEIGTRIEMEHTNSKTIAKKIAKDHLKEFPKYYTKGLIPMEKRLRKTKGGKNIWK